jgi:hypothetical protein
MSAYKTEQTRVLSGYSEHRPTRQSFPSESRLIDFRPQTQPAQSIEADKFTKVAQVRKMFATVLGPEEPRGQTDDKSYTEAMTLYTVKTDNSFLQKTFRPTSAGIFTRPSRLRDFASLKKLEMDRHHDLADLFESKKKLSRHNLPITMRSLEAGLMKPDDLPESKLVRLPTAGALLMSNPLDKVKKGKAKRKRGKKGK